MFIRMKKLAGDQKGSAIMLIAVAMLGLLTMAGLVLDGGTIYLAKSHLKKTANAAVLSGAQELTNQESVVHGVVQKILLDHKEQNSLVGTNVQMSKNVKVDLKKQVPLSFSQLLGWQNVPVASTAAAEIGTMGSAVGAAPLGIDQSVSLEYYQEYKLKVDQTEVSTGTFGVLALGGTGASTYEENLRNGYKNRLTVNDILDTQTGNIAGKTKTAVQDLIDKCPYPKGETHHRDCPRTLLVPVYEPKHYDGNQLKQVKITGFAYFYILDNMRANDTAIKGLFVKRAGTGFVKPEAVFRGAYAIRLTE